MICLSKADERSLRHLSYNQSPSPLAAKHTTCQDLNGMANLREHVASDQDEDSGGGTPGSSETDEIWHHQLPPKPHGLFLADGGRMLCGASSRRMVKTGGDGQFYPSSLFSPTCRAQVWGWFTWGASVLLVSFALTNIMSMFNDKSHIITEPCANPATIIESVLETPILTQNHHSRDVGKPSCASGGASSAKYNTTLHVIALLVIWFVSTLSCAFALLAKKFPGLRIPQRFFFVVRHFGTGVLIATAFVHLLPTAFVSLGSPCLGDFWTKDYPAMPGAIALASIFFVTVIEMVFHPARRCTSMPSSEPKAKIDEQAIDDSDPPPENGGVDTLMRNMAPPRSRTSSVGHGLNRLPTITDDENSPRVARDALTKDDDKVGSETTLEAASVTELSPELKLRKERLQCVLLELGILFHSVFIGMSLSVSVGNEFVVLFIAIIFHQTFEGLALGSRIAMVKWPQGSRRQPWLMALAYGLTTPIGQALGIATHTLYSPDSEVGLIVVGVMNSISAGLLTFASLVELMSEDFLSDESWKYLRGKKRFIACLLVFLGAFCMSLVGAWA